MARKEGEVWGVHLDEGRTEGDDAVARAQLESLGQGKTEPVTTSDIDRLAKAAGADDDFHRRLMKGL